MSTEFLRLYRELSRAGPDADVNDDYFLRERKAVLRSIGHDIGEVTDPVPLPKYHGRAARRFGLAKRQKAIGVDSKQEAMKNKAFFDVSSKASKIYVLTKEMQEYMAKSEPIPNRIWQKYNALFDGSPTDSSLQNSSRPSLLAPINTRQNSNEISQHRASITIRRPDAILRRDFSGNIKHLDLIIF